uniref:Uncharacterized protein n=1 Tax=Spironucleus salmonicida TaxID=348837 RepID=V6LIF3_9EUKA|eukprot:EST44365.1 Hypothetical protein SS50377_15796 [Spironucleus salmonicida]
MNFLESSFGMIAPTIAKMLWFRLPARELPKVLDSAGNPQTYWERDLGAHVRSSPKVCCCTHTEKKMYAKNMTKAPYLCQNTPANTAIWTSKTSCTIGIKYRVTIDRDMQLLIKVLITPKAEPETPQKSESDSTDSEAIANQ